MTLVRDWLPGSGLQLDARPRFEYYAPEMAMDQQTGAFQCEICVPVTNL